MGFSRRKVTDPIKGKKKKKKSGDPVGDSIKKDYPNYRVRSRRGNAGAYTLTSRKTGASFGMTRHPAKPDPKRITTTQAVAMQMKKQ